MAENFQKFHRIITAAAGTQSHVLEGEGGLRKTNITEKGLYQETKTSVACVSDQRFCS